MAGPANAAYWLGVLLKAVSRCNRGQAAWLRKKYHHTHESKATVLHGKPRARVWTGRHDAVLKHSTDKSGDPVPHNLKRETNRYLVLEIDGGYAAV